RNQPFDQRYLCRIDLFSGRRGRKKLPPVDLGKLARSFRARRPRHREGVAARGRSSGPGALEGPGVNDLSTALRHGSEGNEVRGSRGAGLGALTGFFLELSRGRVERNLAGTVKPFGNGPYAQVLVPEERPPGMDQEHLE